jgi:hypothetical protein
MSLHKIIAAISNIPIVVAAFYAALLYKKLDDTLKVLAWYLFFSVVVQEIAFAISLYKINNMILLHLNVYGSVGLLGWFYAKVLDGFIHKRTIQIMLLVFGVGCLLDILINNPLLRFNSWLLLAECVLMIVLSLFTFSFLLNVNIKVLKKEQYQSLMWINSGIFIYFLSNILLFFFYNMLNAASVGQKMTAKLWIGHGFFITIMFCSFIIGLWKRQRN